MNPLAKAIRLWHTVRWLKPVQVYGRVRFRLSRPKPDLRAAPAVRTTVGAWVEPAHREPSMIAASQLRFLGEERDLDAHGWDDPSLAKLWRYNLHYFDDLVAHGASERAAWHRALIARWIAECPPVRGTAWEPYPISLRVVNWIKWLRAGNPPVPGMLDSLAAQVRHLSRRLEWHLLGNHLFVNAKALVIAGLYFEGEEADRWRAMGWRILRAEIPEQILADGGQFERSPMYHALAVEDMLDLLNAMGCHAGVSSEADLRLVSERIPAMRRFLAAVCHPDGEVSSFNDSAQGVAPKPAELEAYAGRLGFGAARPGDGAASRVAVLEPSGFVRVEAPSTGLVAILDVGPVGPDYLPGHAHADTLSFELSIGGTRVLVNSGTSQYGLGPERLRQRGTAAHNTVTVDGQDSSEVWGGFRVARRARVSGLTVDDRGASVGVVAEHDGFTRLPRTGPHRRAWAFDADGSLVVRDRIETGGEALSHWHFAPGFELSVSEDGRRLTAVGAGLTFQFSAEGAVWNPSRSKYHPRFGLSVPNWKATARFEGPEAAVRIEWHPCTSSS